MKSDTIPAPLPAVSRPLVAWYRANARDLPWRHSPDPYRVWVSEIMLQQTRVETVKPYFERFLSVLPNVKALAEASEETLLKLWEGLGYYSRVRNMQKAARQITEDFGGEFPKEKKDLLSLCGIGSYTAGAIAAFAFGLPEAAVDGNVLRVVARLCADDRNVLDPAVKADAEAVLTKVVPSDAPSDFGQGLIELGALVCLPPPASPKCEECPLAEVCLARAQGLTGILPVRLKKTERKREDRTVLVISDGQRYLLRKRPSTGLLAGLWEFPSLSGRAEKEDVLRAAREMGLSVSRAEPLGDARHVFTHLVWDMTGWLVTVDEGACAGGVFVSPEEIGKTYALPSALSVYRRAVH